MILEVYDKTTNERVGMIKTYSFVQYTKYFNDIGVFSLKVPLEEPIINYLLKKDNYILFDKTVMGVIKYINKQSLENTTIEIKGYLINHILSYRSFLKTKSYSGELFEIQRQMVTDLFINPTDSRRTISLIELDTTYPESETIVYQNTGGKLSDVLTEMNYENNYGFDLQPRIVKYNEQSDNPTNIGGFTFIQKVPTDRTIRNTDDNSPVVFSSKLSNLSDMIFTDDSSEYCSIAYVAGEGEGEQRTGILVGDNLNVFGLNRIELFVDARDIQKQKEDGTEFTESEYEELLKQRGIKYLEDNSEYITIDATTITNGNNSFIFNEDYFIGDFVTIQDEQIGIEVDLQIIGVTKSITEQREVLDLIFGKEKMSIYKRVKNMEGGNK